MIALGFISGYIFLYLNANYVSQWTYIRKLTIYYTTWMVSKCQLNVPLPEGKRATKRQLYSEPFTLREAASSIFKQQW